MTEIWNSLTFYVALNFEFFFLQKRLHLQEKIVREKIWSKVVTLSMLFNMNLPMDSCSASTFFLYGLMEKKTLEHFMPNFTYRFCLQERDFERYRRRQGHCLWRRNGCYPIVRGPTNIYASNMKCLFLEEFVPINIA